MGRPFKCPCGSTDTTSKGFRKTKTLGLRRIRRCRACGRKFTPKNQQPLEVVLDAESSASDDPADQPAATSGEPSPQSSSPS
jgi:transcriptional regulator NrdR family protein